MHERTQPSQTMKKRILAGSLFIVMLLMLTGCKADQQTTMNQAYTPVQDSQTISYDESADTTTVTNGEASFQLPGKWEEKDGCCTHSDYGSVHFIRYNGIVTVYDYTNEYSSSAKWNIADQESQLTITPYDDKIIYGFHINSTTSTYQFIYTSNSDTQGSVSATLLATILANFQLQRAS